ncbi:hypothetical protein ABK040_007393 [Willaertia magna]
MTTLSAVSSSLTTNNTTTSATNNEFDDICSIDSQDELSLDEISELSDNGSINNGGGNNVVTTYSTMLENKKSISISTTKTSYKHYKSYRLLKVEGKVNNVFLIRYSNDLSDDNNNNESNIDLDYKDQNFIQNPLRDNVENQYNNPLFMQMSGKSIHDNYYYGSDAKEDEYFITHTPSKTSNDTWVEFINPSSHSGIIRTQRVNRLLSSLLSSINEHYLYISEVYSPANLFVKPSGWEKLKRNVKYLQVFKRNREILTNEITNNQGLSPRSSSPRKRNTVKLTSSITQRVRAASLFVRKESVMQAKEERKSSVTFDEFEKTRNVESELSPTPFFSFTENSYHVKIEKFLKEEEFKRHVELETESATFYNPLFEHEHHNYILPKGFHYNYVIPLMNEMKKACPPQMNTLILLRSAPLPTFTAVNNSPESYLSFVSVSSEDCKDDYKRIRVNSPNTITPTTGTPTTSTTTTTVFENSMKRVSVAFNKLTNVLEQKEENYQPIPSDTESKWEELDSKQVIYDSHDKTVDKKQILTRIKYKQTVRGKDLIDFVMKKAEGHFSKEDAIQFLSILLNLQVGNGEANLEHTLTLLVPVPYHTTFYSKFHENLLYRYIDDDSPAFYPNEILNVKPPSEPKKKRANDNLPYYYEDVSNLLPESLPIVDDSVKTEANEYIYQLDQPLSNLKLVSLLEKVMSLIEKNYIHVTEKAIDYNTFYYSDDFSILSRIVTLLRQFDPLKLDTSQKKPFFINLYNIMQIHSYIIKGCGNTQEQRAEFLDQPFYFVGKYKLSMNDISDYILRARDPPHWKYYLTDYQINYLENIYELNDKPIPFDPRIHFVLSNGCKSSPLPMAIDCSYCEHFLDSATKEYINSEVTFSRNTIFMPAIFKTNRKDFSPINGSLFGALHFISQYLKRQKKEELFELLQESKITPELLVYYATLNIGDRRDIENTFPHVKFHIVYNDFDYTTNAKEYQEEDTYSVVNDTTTAPSASTTKVDVKFNDVLNHPSLRKYFRAFCETEYSTENIDFYEHVERYKQTGNDEERWNFAKEMFDRFLCPDSPSEVNVTKKLISAARRQIFRTKDEHETYVKLPFDLFDKLCKEVEIVLVDSFIRFIYSEIYDLMSREIQTSERKKTFLSTNASFYSKVALPSKVISDIKTNTTSVISDKTNTSNTRSSFSVESSNLMSDDSFTRSEDETTETGDADEETFSEQTFNNETNNFSYIDNESDINFNEIIDAKNKKVTTLQTEQTSDTFDEESDPTTFVRENSFSNICDEKESMLVNEENQENNVKLTNNEESNVKSTLSENINLLNEIIDDFKDVIQSTSENKESTDDIEESKDEKTEEIVQTNQTCLDKESSTSKEIVEGDLLRMRREHSFESDGDFGYLASPVENNVAKYVFPLNFTGLNNSNEPKERHPILSPSSSNSSLGEESPHSERLKRDTKKPSTERVVVSARVSSKILEKIGQFTAASQQNDLERRSSTDISSDIGKVNQTKLMFEQIRNGAFSLKHKSPNSNSPTSNSNKL